MACGNSNHRSVDAPGKHAGVLGALRLCDHVDRSIVRAYTRFGAWYRHAPPPELGNEAATDLSQLEGLQTTPPALCCQCVHDAQLPLLTVLRELLGDDEMETACVLFVDREQRFARRLLRVEGHASSVDLRIRAIIAAALRLDAAGLLVAHRHPSGRPYPSEQDIEATRTLIGLSAKLDLAVHDHIIVTADVGYSMRQSALL